MVSKAYLRRSKGQKQDWAHIHRLLTGVIKQELVGQPPSGIKEPVGVVGPLVRSAAMEAQNTIEEANPRLDLDLSEQCPLSCSPGSCDGWRLSRTLNWLRDKGTVDELVYPIRQMIRFTAVVYARRANGNLENHKLGWINPALLVSRPFDTRGHRRSRK